jgi:hypothetical protein
MNFFSYLMMKIIYYKSIAVNKYFIDIIIRNALKEFFNYHFVMQILIIIVQFNY